MKPLPRTVDPWTLGHHRPAVGIHSAWLFPSVILATLLQNSYDLAALFSGESLNLTTYEGPILYKLCKDFLYFCILVAILSYAYRSERTPLTRSAVSVIFIVVSLAAISAYANGPVVAVLGLRWAFPFILFLLLRDWAATINAQSASRWLLLGSLICLGAQIYELFHMPPVFGEVFDGIPARTPGIFIAPNSAAFFGCATAGGVLVFTPTSLTKCWLAIVLAAAISTLAQSGSGMIAACLLAIRFSSQRRTVFFWAATAAAVPLIFLSLDTLTRRDEYVLLSGGGRLAVLATIVEHSALSVTNFGVFTNAAILQNPTLRDFVIPDSLLASWLGNFGVTALPAALLSVQFVRSSMRTVDWRATAPCWITFGIFSMTTIVFEAFPMNLILALGLWSARKYRVSPLPIAARRSYGSEAPYL